ncbi:MAG: sigma factor, partial [Planctomycetota bacterium]
MQLRSTDALFRQYCKTGDPKALAVVFDRTAPELLRIAGWLSGQRACAEDLLQRTFLLAIEARATFDGDQRALPWLCGILTNQARNLMREKARRARLVNEGATVRGPEQAAQDTEFAAAVAAARS